MSICSMSTIREQIGLDRAPRRRLDDGRSRGCRSRRGTAPPRPESGFRTRRRARGSPGARAVLSRITILKSMPPPKKLSLARAIEAELKPEIAHARYVEPRAHAGAKSVVSGEHEYGSFSVRAAPAPANCPSVCAERLAQIELSRISSTGIDSLHFHPAALHIARELMYPA